MFFCCMRKVYMIIYVYKQEKGSYIMEKLKKLISIIVLIIVLPILFVNIVILVDSLIHPDEVPSFFGYKPFIVLSGSMKDTIDSGDLVITKECDTKDLKVGDIISFKEKEMVITHRISAIKQENGEIKYITKGDNNETEDLNPVLPENVEGIYLRRIPRLGNVAMFIQTPIGIIVALSIPLAILICINLSRFSDESDKKTEEMEKEIERLKKENENLKK